MCEKKIKTLSFKVTADLKNKIDEMAREESRTTSNFVIKILTDYIDEIEEAKRKLERR